MNKPAVQMRAAQNKDANAITELTCICFGDAYTSEDEIRTFIADDRNHLYVACDENGLAAAILFLYESRSALEENLDVTGADYDRIGGGRSVLHYKFSVVREDVRGRGLMTGMLQQLLELLREDERYGALFVQAWIKQGEIPLEGILRRNEFKVYRKQIRPWWKYHDRSCNICGGRCKCDAMVYYRKL
jgi:GNAT superfamily N-acetyltransferase